MLAEPGQGLWSVLVEASEHGECRLSEAPLEALAAEAAVGASDRRAELAAEVGSLDRAVAVREGMTASDSGED